MQDSWNAQTSYFNNNVQLRPAFPIMPHCFRKGLIYLTTILSLADANPSSFQHNIAIKKVLPGLKYLLHPLLATHFTSPLVENTNYCLTTAQLHDFVEIRNKYEVYSSSFNVHASNCSGVLDNSANVHVINDKSLYTSPIIKCPLGLDMGTVVGSNTPLGIGTAKMT